MKYLLIALPLLALSSAASAQNAASVLGKDAFSVKPSLVYSDDNTSATFGLAYEFKKSLVSVASQGDLDVTKPRDSFSVIFEGSGLITARAEDNPENLLVSTIRIAGRHVSGGDIGDPIWQVSGGFFGSLETDQSMENQQVVLGFTATFAALHVVPGANDSFGLQLNYGQVQPGEDLARKTALGVTTLENYDRFSAEVSYKYQTGWSLVPGIEFNYRWMTEIDAPAAIVAADLERFDMFTVRAGLPANLYVAYSEGKLPFDLEDDRVFKAGFSYELGELGRLLQGGSR